MLDHFIRKSEMASKSAQVASGDDRGTSSSLAEATQSLQTEVEQLGAELGKRVCDQLAIGQEEQ